MGDRPNDSGVSPPQDIHKYISGHYELHLEVYSPEDPRASEDVIKGVKRGEAGYSLRDLRTMIGGDEGLATDPFLGERHRLSLKEWQDADPERTRCYLSYRFVPDESDAQRAQEYLAKYVSYWKERRSGAEE